jgi:uncharacterized repeat protein (TIGR03803 family)
MTTRRPALTTLGKLFLSLVTFALLAATALSIYAQQPAHSEAPNGSEPPVFLAVDVAPPGTASRLRTLHSFTGEPDGANPYGGVVIGKDGVLYGTTQQGGTLGYPLGTVFSVTPPVSLGGAWTEAVLYYFTSYMSGSDGIYPRAGVVIGSGGVLYGTTEYGGNYDLCPGGCGTVFSLTPPASPGGAWTETVLHTFMSTDGIAPWAGVVIGSGGVLYGTTTSGGASNSGTVFSLTPPTSPGGTWTETTLYSFLGRTGDGASPFAGVVIGSSGVLFGTTCYGGTGACVGSLPGCGTVFALIPPQSLGGPWTERVLHHFSGNDGNYPSAALVIGKGGVLYGTAEQGGTSNSGTVFSITPPKTPGGAWTEAVFYNFTGYNGFTDASVVIGKGGVLYGTTRGNGTSTSGYGTVFALKP